MDKKSCTQNDIDILNRENFIQTLYELIESYRKNNQGGGFAIYGNWGVGKTFVLNRLEERLSPNNYIVLSYSAWEYDYYDEPLIALLAAIKDTLSKNGWNDDQKKVFKEKLPALLYGLTKITTLTIAGINPPVAAVIAKLLELPEKFVDDCKKETKNLAFDNKSTFKSALKKFQDLLNEISQKHKLIFLIDELDRCLPQYQIKVLEHMHHLSKGIDCICVYAISDNQLRHTISNIFGGNVDFNGYMKKFIDFHLTLENAPVNDNILERHKNDIKNFKPLSTPKDNEIVIDLIKVMLSSLNIRIQEKIWSKQKLLHSITFPKDSKQSLFILGCEIMFLSMLERQHRYAYERKSVTNRLDYNITYVDFINNFFPLLTSPPSKPRIEKHIAELFQRYTDEIYKRIIPYKESTNQPFPSYKFIFNKYDNINILIIKILYIWTKVTDNNTIHWEDIPQELNDICLSMKSFYTKAILMQDKN